MSVLDASAVIAWMRGEAGHEVVQAALNSGEARLCSVNLAEVLSHFAAAGLDDAALAQLTTDLHLSGVKLVAFGEDDARRVAALRLPTRAQGLSLGDRACLALAQKLGVSALSADRAWAGVNCGVAVTLIR